MATLTPSPRMQFFDANGNPLSGGKLYTYAAGTVTPLATFTDSTGGTPNANPIVLDSRGEASIWLGTSLYYMELRTSADALIWSADNVGGVATSSALATSLATLAASGGSSLIGFIQAGSGATLRTAQAKMRDVVSVKDFGATGDGTTDDTLAIQAAINYCQDNLKALYFPGNNPSVTYKTTATLNITKPIHIFGDGSRNVTIAATGLIAGQYVIDMDGTAFGTYEQGYLSGLSLLGTAGDCLHIKNISNSMFSDLLLRNSRHGIVYTGTRCFSNSFEKITGQSLSGTNVLVTAHTGGGQHSFRECSLSGATGFNVDSTSSVDNVVFFDTNFEQCTSNSFNCSGSIFGLSFFGCRTEGCLNSDYLVIPTTGNIVNGLVIHGNTFSASNSGGLSRIFLGGSAGTVRGFDITGNVVTHGTHAYAANFVNLNGDGESGVIANNYLDGAILSCAPVNAARPNVSVFNNEGNNGKFAGTIPVETTGLWTPTDASGAALTFTSAGGSWNKVGTMLFYQGAVVYPATASGAGALIGGLPETIGNPSGVPFAGRAGGSVDATDSVAVSILQMIGTKTVRPDKANITNATNAELSGKTIYFSGMYRI